MDEKFLRTYLKYPLNEVKAHLLVYGDISGSCANCQKIDLKLEMNTCPGCQTEFKFVSFRNVKSHLPKIQKLAAQRPSLTIIDYDDYKRATGVNKAEDFFK